MYCGKNTQLRKLKLVVHEVSLRLYKVKPFYMYSVERIRERNEFGQFVKTVRLHVSKDNRPVDLEGSS
jgi:hypothetical protein